MFGIGCPTTPSKELDPVIVAKYLPGRVLDDVLRPASPQGTVGKIGEFNSLICGTSAGAGARGRARKN